MNAPAFKRQLRVLAWLRALYVAIVGLAAGGLVAYVISLLTRKS